MTALMHHTQFGDFRQLYRPQIDISVLPATFFNFAAMPVERAAQNLNSLLIDTLALPSINSYRMAGLSARFWTGMQGMDKMPDSPEESAEVFDRAQELKTALQDQPGYKALPEAAQRWLDTQIKRGWDTEHASLRLQLSQPGPA